MSTFIDPRLQAAITPFWPGLTVLGSHIGGSMVTGEGSPVSLSLIHI